MIISAMGVEASVVQRHGYRLGENLFTTRDDDQGGLDSGPIHETADEYASYFDAFLKPAGIREMNCPLLMCIKHGNGPSRAGAECDRVLQYVHEVGDAPRQEAIAPLPICRVPAI